MKGNSWLIGQVVETTCVFLIKEMNLEETIGYVTSDEYFLTEEVLRKDDFTYPVTNALRLEALNKDVLLVCMTTRAINQWMLGAVLLKPKHIIIIDSMRLNDDNPRIYEFQILAKLVEAVYIAGNIRFDLNE